MKGRAGMLLGCRSTENHWDGMSKLFLRGDFIALPSLYSDCKAQVLQSLPCRRLGATARALQRQQPGMSEATDLLLSALGRTAWPLPAWPCRETSQQRS